MILPVNGIGLALILPALLCAQYNVAVFTFDTETEGFKPPPSIQGFTVLYKTELASHGRIKVLEREKLKDITSEIALSQSGLLSESKTSIDPDSLEGVDYVIGGQIVQTGDQEYRVDLSIREVSTARIISEKISGNVEEHADAAAKMLAANTVHVLSGEGDPVRRRVIRRVPAIVALAVAVIGAGAGFALRSAGEDVYKKEYGAGDMPLDDFDTSFERAQFLTSIGEGLISLGGCGAVTAGIIAVSGRSRRTLTRE